MQLVSIIIPAYNEESYIEKTLKSIENQTYPNIEIIVVCNGCLDNTEKVIKKYNVKCLSLKERSVSLSRNIGAYNAKGGLLVFLDADTVISTDTIERIVKKLKTGPFFGTIKGVSENSEIKLVIVTEIKNIINLFIYWSNGLVYCRKDDFMKTNGFNVNLDRGELRMFFREISNYAKYVRLNTARVMTSQRRIKKFGIKKILYFWLRDYMKPIKKEYGAIR